MEEMPSGVLCPVGLARTQLKSVELLPLLPKSTGWLLHSLPISLAKPQFSDIFRRSCSSAWNPHKVGFHNNKQPRFFQIWVDRREQGESFFYFFFFCLANLDWMLQVWQRLLEFSLTKVRVKTAAVWIKLGVLVSLVFFVVHLKGQNTC